MPDFMLPEVVLAKRRKPNEFCIRFFGTHDFCWITHDKVFPLNYEIIGKEKGETAAKNKLDLCYLRALSEVKEISSQIETINSAGSYKSIRPKHYVKILNNQAVAPVKFNAVSLEEENVCECKPTDPDPCGYTSNCYNRILMIECNKTSCKAQSHCQNQLFQKHEYPTMEIFYTNGRGWGLRATEDIHRDQFVIEYVGEVIDKVELEKRMRAKEKNHDDNFYFLTMDRNLTIDAEPKGNLARFMNHSCEPNCQASSWMVNGNTRVGLFALCDIKAVSLLIYFKFHILQIC